MSVGGENYSYRSGLEARARASLSPLGLTPTQKREAWEAFKCAPDGVERIAESALRAQARNPELRAAAIFLTDIRSGHHLLEKIDPGPPKTGWRWVRGNTGAAGTYLEDPNGTDPLPPGYDLTTKSGWGKPGEWREPDEWREPEKLDFEEWKK